MDRGESGTARADPEITLPVFVEETDPVLRQSVALVEMNWGPTVFEYQIQAGIDRSEDEGAVAEFEGAGDRTPRPRIGAPIFDPLSVLPPADSLLAACQPGAAAGRRRHAKYIIRMVV